MSDIVDRLRAAASHPYNQHGPQEWIGEAADEITTLRAEVEKLRAALEEVEQVALNYVHMKYAKLARAALGERT